MTQHTTDPTPPATTQKQRMLAGELYDAGDEEIQADLAATREWLVRYNAALGMDSADRRVLLAERFGAVGDGSTVRQIGRAHV